MQHVAASFRSLTDHWRVPATDASVAALARPALLGAVVVVALVLRATHLGVYGFSEDEVNKVRAVDRYEAGDYSANAEHPMLMKLVMAGSLHAAHLVNHATHDLVISDEAALRLPNAVAGAVTAGLVFLVAELFFGISVAAWASFLWVVDINATAINRLGKEDSLLLMFFLLGVWLYERGRVVGAASPADAQRWYAGSGAAFGLMLATKYMPQYFVLYLLFNRVMDRAPGSSRPRWAPYAVAFAGAFLIANFGVLEPRTWANVLNYAHGGSVAHHGYVFAGAVYASSLWATPWGLPVYFYLAFFLAKVPLIVLGLIAAGLLQLARQHRDRGYAFLGTFIVFLFVGHSIVATKFLRYMLPLLALLDIVAAIGLVWISRRLAMSLPGGAAGRLAHVAAGASVVVGLLVSHVAAGPYYSLYLNPAGHWLAPPGSLFPTDELYDAGADGAVAAIARAASPGAVVVSDATAVVRHYLDTAGRSDVASTSLSMRGLPGGDVETWIVAQPAHTYFENVEVLERLRRTERAWKTVYVRGVLAVQVFRHSRIPDCAATARALVAAVRSSAGDVPCP